MSETGAALRHAYQGICAAWRDAPKKNRQSAAYYLIGTALIGLAIVLQFGWLGVLFCLGMFFLGASKGAKL